MGRLVWHTGGMHQAQASVCQGGGFVETAFLQRYEVAHVCICRNKSSLCIERWTRIEKKSEIFKIGLVR